MPLGYFDQGLACGLGQVKVNRCATHAGSAWLLVQRRGSAGRGVVRCASSVQLAGQGGNGQAGDPALDRVGQCAIDGHLPSGFNRFEQALRCIRRDGRVGCRAQRQAVGNFCHGRQVQPVGLQFSCLVCFASRAAAGHGQVAAWPAQAVLGVKAQTLGCEFKTIGQLPPSEPARDRCQRQRFERFSQLCINVCQRHVNGRGTNAPFAHISPCAHTAVAGLDVNTQRLHAGVLLDVRYINAAEICKQLARPVGPLPGMP